MVRRITTAAVSSTESYRVLSLREERSKEREREKNSVTMLNQAVVEALYSATYIENYLDCVENLPNDLQRHVSRLRELDATCQSNLNFWLIFESFELVTFLLKLQFDYTCCSFCDFLRNILSSFFLLLFC